MNHLTPPLPSSQLGRSIPEAATQIPSGVIENLEEINPTPLAGKEGKQRKPKYIDRFTPVPTKPGNTKEKQGNDADGLLPGAGGDVVRLHANYFDVKFSNTEPIHQFQVEFNPVPATRPQRFRIIRDYTRAKGLEKEDYVFDGSNILYAGGRGLAVFERGTVLSVIVDEKIWKVRVWKVQCLDKESPQALVLLNSQLNKFQEHALKMVRIRDNYFDPAGKLTPEGYLDRLKIWPGFEASINLYENNRLLLNLDQRFRIIRNEYALAAMKAAWGAASKAGQNTEQCQAQTAKVVVGQTIETSYNHLVYRVQAVNWSTTAAEPFKVRVKVGNRWEIKEQTVAEYHNQRYGLTVTDISQPLLVVRPANKSARRNGVDQIWLVPEFCRLTGYTDQIRQDFPLMQAVSKHTKLEPARRKQATEGFAQRLANNENIQKELSNWEVSYGKEMVKYSYNSQEADWSRHVRMNPVETAKHCDRWMVVCTERDKTTAEGFIREIYAVAGPMGMRFGIPTVVPIANDSAVAYCEAIRNNFRQDLGLVVVVLQTKAKERYDAIKDLLCVRLPCPSQCVLTKTISGAPGKVKSVATMVVQQINGKLGGDIWKMNFPFKKPTMVVGIDTQRDRTTSKTVVVGASAWNKGFSMYQSSAHFANDDDDVLKCVPKVIREFMDDVHSHNKVYPSAVYIYRDGISEGQLQKIRDVELFSVRNLIEAYSTQEKITLTYILVNKRESTRFFLEKNGEVGNPLPGTIVDNTLTQPWRYDFYLVSQVARQGSAAPTYYNVIADDSRMEPAHMQEMTYMMCHLYQNWPGTVGVPAPVQYARKHAQLVALNIHKAAAPALQKKLFYL